MYRVEDEIIVTRNRAREIINEAVEEGAAEIDLSNVENISRSVADELVYSCNEYNLSLNSATPQAKNMIKAVKETAVADA